MSSETPHRFTFITQILGWEGQINATNLALKFSLSRPAATNILKQYREQYPEYLRYNKSKKAFVITSSFEQFFDPNSLDYNFASYLTATVPKTENEQNFIGITSIEVDAPLRNLNPAQTRPILRAIREKLAIDIGYISLSSPNYLDRIIQPHALIFDGLRWHVRAFCNKNQQYRDFNLSRFNGEATFEGKATNLSTDDERWHTEVGVVIQPDPRLNEQQQRVIEQDFQMTNGQITITTRAALVNYLIRRLHLDNYKNIPEEQQIVLTQESRKQIAPYLPKPT
jgi:hypothetical protein